MATRTGTSANRSAFVVSGSAAPRSVVRGAVALALLAMAASASKADPVQLLPNPNPAGKTISIPDVFVYPAITDVVNSVVQFPSSVQPFENYGTIWITRAFVVDDYYSGVLTNRDPGTVLLNRGGIYIGPSNASGPGGTLVNTEGAVLLNQSSEGAVASINVDGILKNYAKGATLTNEGGIITGTGFVFNQAIVTNTGRGAWMNVGLANVGAAATLTNEAGALLSGFIQNLGGATLINTGVFGSGDDLTRLGVSSLNNSDSGTQLINRGFANLTNEYGNRVLNQDGASLLNTDGATIFNQNGGSFTNTGPGTQFTNQGWAQIQNLDSGTSLVNQNGARLTNAGASFLNGFGAQLVNQAGAVLANQDGGAFYNESATLVNVGATLTNTGSGTTLINLGNATIRNTGGGTLSNEDNASFENQAGSTVINEPGATLRNSAAIVNDGRIQNSGTFEVTANGTVSGTGSFSQTAGSLAVDGTMTQSVLNFTGGLVCGTGTLNGSPASSNTRWRPGTCSPLGTLHINGDFLFDSGVVEIDVAGLSPGEFGALAITGTAAFKGGTIELDFLDGFVPAEGDAIAFLLAGSIEGFDHLTFASNGLPAGTTFDVQLGPDGHTLAFVVGPTVVPEPAAWGLMVVGLAALPYLARARKQERG